MSLKHGLLGLISSDGAMTGYELDKFFKNSLNYFWSAKSSQIYRELSAMEELGWLSSERVLQKEKPNKRVYSITETGKAELFDWILSSEPVFGTARSTFMMRIFLAGEAGEAGKNRVLEMLHKYKESCKQAGENFQEIKKEIAGYDERGELPEHTKYWKITLLQGEMATKMAAEWAEKSIKILEENS